ncbi:MAG: metallophosphoesterase [Treponemataceae bacterium]
MRFLIISDGHGNSDMLDKLNEEFKKSDIVLFAGDFAKFGRKSTGKLFLEKLVLKHEKIFAVLGNCDEQTFIEQLEKADISVENSLVYSDGLVFIGSGGGSKFTGTTPFERDEKDLVFDLHLVSDQIEHDWSNLVVIMHNPPKDTKCDIVGKDIHVGSSLLRQWIEQVKPLLVVTGHIHESRGIDSVGETSVMNPGALCDGNYGVVELENTNGRWKITKLELLSV